jgi:ankyrin repeat protein
MEHAIQEAWESLEPLNVDYIVHLVKTQERDVNYPLKETGQTLLMTVAGSVNNAAGEIGEVLSLGGDPFQGDGEGHTAFHWAAIHGRASAVGAMASAYTTGGLVLGGKPPRVVVLGPHTALVEGLGRVCKQGRTALATVTSTEAELKAKEGELVAALAASPQGTTSKVTSELEAKLQGVKSTLAALPATRQALIDAMKGEEGKASK